MKKNFIINCPACGTELFTSDKHESCHLCGEFMYVEFNAEGAKAIAWDEHVNCVRDEMKHECYDY